MWTLEQLQQPWSDFLQQPDEELALHLLADLLKQAAEKLRIPVKDVTEDMAMSILLKMAATDSDSLNAAALEKVVRRMEKGDLAGAGRLFREWMLEGERMTRLARVDADRKRQVKGFSEEGVRARRKHSETDKNGWRTDAAQFPANLSKIAKAKLIAKRRNLGKEAIRTIRKEI